MAQADTCMNCDEDATEDLNHVWWQCEAWEGIRQQHPSVTAAHSSHGSTWPNCLARCAIATKSSPGNMDAALLTDLQRMFVKIRLAAWKADESDERKTRGVAPAQAYPWDWTPEHTFKLPNKCAEKYPINMHGNSVELQLALADWLANLEWCEDRRVSHMELIMDFEIRSGLDFLYSQADYEEKLETAPVDVNPADSDPRHGSPPGAEASPKSEGVKDEEEEGVDTSSADGSSGSRHEGAVETRPAEIVDTDSSGSEGATRRDNRWMHPLAVKAGQFGAMLQGSLRRHNGGKEVLPGRSTKVYHLKALGGGVAAGRSCRPILGAETLKAIQGMKCAIEEELKTDALKNARPANSMGTWVGKFKPRLHYPNDEVRGTRAQRWFDASASIGRCGRRYLAKEHVAPSTRRGKPRPTPSAAQPTRTTARGTANRCAGLAKRVRGGCTRWPCAAMSTTETMMDVLQALSSTSFHPPRHRCQWRVARSATLTAHNLWGARCTEHRAPHTF